MNGPISSGVLWGVNWERYHWGITCYAYSTRDGAYLVSRQYAGNGSDPVRVRESVQAFRREMCGCAV